MDKLNDKHDTNNTSNKIFETNKEKRKKCKNIYETDFIIDELNLYSSWNSRYAVDLLYYFSHFIGTPHTLNLNQNGLAHYINYNIKDKVFNELPIIWYEILIQDEYILDKYNKSKQINPLYCYYKIDLKDKEIDLIGKLNKYNILYDNNKKCISINTNNFIYSHILLKITLDYIKHNNIDINKFNTYLDSFKVKYNTPKELYNLILKIKN